MNLKERINQYTFGRIVVEGKEYQKDLILLPQRIISNWWRKEGHKICLEDIQEALLPDIKIFIVGTGAYGMMLVLPEVTQFLRSKDIELIDLPTSEACKVYNEYWLRSPLELVGAFHLTC